MFDLDVSKILMVGVVALVVVGPKDLPRALGELGRTIGKMRRIRNEVRGQVRDLMKEADLDGVKKEFDALDRSSRIDIAIDPKTAMRGQLPSTDLTASGSATAHVEPTFVSPEMQDYLSASPTELSPFEPVRVSEAATELQASEENSAPRSNPEPSHSGLTPTGG